MNLIYYIYWKPENGMLDLNLDYLSRYIHLFDTKIIKISGVEKVPAHYIELYPFLKDAIYVENNDKHEAEHFKQSLEQVNGCITFYAHAKGVSREVTPERIKWVRHLYVYSLCKVPDLSDKLFCGCFGKIRPGSKKVPTRWHYTGTFYWFRTDEVKQRYSKMKMPKNINTRWFTECFPGWIATEDEAIIRLFSSHKKNYSLANPEWWQKNHKKFNYDICE